MTRPVLITIDEVLAKAVVDENADIRYLMNSIEVAEERYIVPAISDAFYEDFINKKNVVVNSGNQTALLASINTSLAAAGKNPIGSGDLQIGMMVNAIEMCPGNYQNLWNRFLWKIIAEAVDICAIIPSWTRSTAQGQMQNNPKTLSSDGQGSATADRKDIEYKIDTMCQQRLYPLIARMKKWIGEQGSYNLFPSREKNDGINKEGKGGIILGLYDDRSPNGPNLWQFDGRGYGYGNERRGCCGDGPGYASQAPQTAVCQLILEIVETPDPSQKYTMCNGMQIPLQYPTGMTLTIPHLIGLIVNQTIQIDNSDPFICSYDSSAGTFDNTAGGGFVDGNTVVINYNEIV